MLRPEAFRAWFGRSKVVDDQGDPLVVYHGTRADFRAFEHACSEATPWLLGQDQGHGFFFAKDPGQRSDSGTWGGAAGFAGVRQVDGETVVAPGGSIMPVYLSLQNPCRMSYAEYLAWGPRPDLREELEALGFDGIEIENGTYVAFEPTQIKSATGNDGTFSGSDPDMGR